MIWLKLNNCEDGHGEDQKWAVQRFAADKSEPKFWSPDIFRTIVITKEIQNSKAHILKCKISFKEQTCWAVVFCKLISFHIIFLLALIKVDLYLIACSFGKVGTTRDPIPGLEVWAILPATILASVLHTQHCTYTPAYIALKESVQHCTHFWESKHT